MLRIDWAGLTQRDMQLMCAHYLANRVHAELQKSEDVCPDTYDILATDFVHNEPVVQVPQYDPTKAKVKYKIDKKLEELLRTLTPEEVRTLLGA